MRRFGVWTTVAALVGAAVFVQCGGTRSDSGDTNTNWLKRCSENKECTDALECVTGVCTRSCTKQQDCSALGSDAVCSSTGICTLPCATVSECHQGSWSCEQKACVPVRDSDAGSSSGGAAGGAAIAQPSTGGQRSTGSTGGKSNPQATGGNHDTGGGTSSSSASPGGGAPSSGGAQPSGGAAGSAGDSTDQTNSGGSSLGGGPPGGAGGAAGVRIESSASGAAGEGQHGTGGGLIVDASPECAERGGDCYATGATDAQCPNGTYRAFSGFCVMQARAICCVPLGGFGSPCDEAHPCDSDPQACLVDTTVNPPGSLCPQMCSQDAQCPAWAACVAVQWSQAQGQCLPRCDYDGNCREGWSCQPHRLSTATATAYASAEVCWGGSDWGAPLGAACTDDNDCLSRVCRLTSTDPGYCTAPCDDASPCVPGYVCNPDTACTTAGCGYCVPE